MVKDEKFGYLDLVYQFTVPLKLVSAIFYQIFIFHQMIALQKIWKMFFYFICKALFVLEIFKFLYFCLLLFSPNFRKGRLPPRFLFWNITSWWWPGVKLAITSEEVSPVSCVNSEKGRLPPKLFAEVKNLQTSQKFQASSYMNTTCRKLDQISFTKINYFFE